MTKYKDKICRNCIYGDKTEYEKPCVIYSDDCKFFKSKPKELIQEYINNGSRITDMFNNCDYCHCDKEGYVKPIDKRGHVFVDTTIYEGNIVVRFNGLKKKYPIKYCPMCGRKLIETESENKDK